MREPLYLFLDFDDTLSDFRALGAQYVAALARLLAHRYGGAEEAWAAAAREEIQAGIARYEERFIGHPLAGYTQWVQDERGRITETVFERVGVALPSDRYPGDLGKRLQFEALAACNAAFPGATDALRDLTRVGVRVQMASSQESDYLRGALAGAGLASFIGRMFGPDLVDCAKEGPEFYRRIFEASGIHPSQALVVDDQPMCLDWAEEAGARVVQACVCPVAPTPEYPVALRSLSDLPRLVQMGVA